MNYLLISGILLVILGIIWSNKNWYNLLIKLFLIGIGVWGIFLYLNQLGYIIKE